MERLSPGAEKRFLVLSLPGIQGHDSTWFKYCKEGSSAIERCLPSPCLCFTIVLTHVGQHCNSKSRVDKRMGDAGEGG